MRIVSRGIRRRLKSDPKLRRRFFLFALFSLALYALLLVFSQEILHISSRVDGVYFLLPVVIVLVYSFVHGGFTNYFWRVLGVRSKMAQGKR
jgi:drug/metabolite transporter (DMT)-like permease